jgi:sterol-4alpha-carboxylate 3-dehydrogenase (decarboxylating)
VLASNRQPSGDFLTCAIRPAGLFGPGDVQLLPPMLQVLRQGRTGFQLGPNTNLFDFTYVGNAAHAHLLAAAALLRTPRGATATIPLDSERVDGEAFFVTNGEPVYFWDFTRMVWKAGAARLHGIPETKVEDKVPGPGKVWELSGEMALMLGTVLEWVMWLLGRKPSLTSQQARYSCRSRYFCIEKARRRLGYRPFVGLEEGIRRGVEDLLKREGLKGKENDGLGEKTGL